MAQEEYTREELQRDIDILEKKMARLKALYEQYFQGIERTPPMTLHKDVARLIHKLSTLRLRRAEQKFRVQAVMQRFSSQKAYWQRNMRMIEEGRHPRQKSKAQRRAANRAPQELTMQDYQAIEAIRKAHGDEAAEEAARARRAKNLAALDAAEPRPATTSNASQAQENDMFESKQAARRRLKEIEEEIEAERAAADLLGESYAPPQRLMREAQEIRSAFTPKKAPITAPAEAVNEIRGVSAEDMQERTQQVDAERAERLRKLRARLNSRKTGAPAAAATRSTSSSNSEQTQAVYERLIAARSSLNQSNDRLSFEAVRQNMSKQAERVRAKHGWDKVNFDVVVKEGKAYLKPVKG